MNTIARLCGCGLLAIFAVGCQEDKPGKYEEPEGGYKSLDINQKTPGGGIPATLTGTGDPDRKGKSVKSGKRKD